MVRNFWNPAGKGAPQPHSVLSETCSEQNAGLDDFQKAFLGCQEKAFYTHLFICTRGKMHSVPPTVQCIRITDK